MDTVRVGIPISNSLVSKRLRAGVAEAAISQIFCESIFQDLLSPRSLDQRSSSEVFEWLISRSPPRAVKELILKILQPLIGNQYDSFEKDLTMVVNHAISLWIKIQRSPDDVVVKLEADTESKIREDLTNGIESINNQQLPTEPWPFMVLFPKIFIEGAPEVLHPGYVLWSANNLAAAGKSELSDQIRRVRNGSSTSVNNSRRRMSFRAKNDNRLL
jgi:hypothetical protein